MVVGDLLFATMRAVPTFSIPLSRTFYTNYLGYGQKCDRAGTAFSIQAHDIIEFSVGNEAVCVVVVVFIFVVLVVALKDRKFSLKASSGQG
jgi:hypothetical protein